MNLITKDPFFGNFLDDFYENKNSNFNTIMKSDIYERDGNYIIEIDIPGFKKEEVYIDYDEGYLTISAKKETVKEDNINYIKRERHYGEYSRSYYIGKMEESKIKAKFEEGTLKITFPKEEEKSTLKQIQID